MRAVETNLIRVASTVAIRVASTVAIRVASTVAIRVASTVAIRNYFYFNCHLQQLYIWSASVTMYSKTFKGHGFHRFSLNHESFMALSIGNISLQAC